MKAMIKSCELLYISNCVKNLSKKYNNYLNELLVSVIIYISIIIEIMGNKNGAIYICFFNS